MVSDKCQKYDILAATIPPMVRKKEKHTNNKIHGGRVGHILEENKTS